MRGDMTYTDGPDFFSDPDVVADPKLFFDHLRSKCPVAKEPYLGTMMVTGYDEIWEILNRKDDTLFLLGLCDRTHPSPTF